MVKTSLAVELAVAAGTDIGRQRETNEDAALAWMPGDPEAGPAALLIVADGLGGHQVGEVASGIAVETLSDQIIPCLEEGTSAGASWETLELHVEEAIEVANRAIYDYAQAELPPGARTATTVACVAIAGTRAVVANVGDTRVYRLRDAEFELLTRDHTRAWDLATAGQIDRARIASHPLRNLLTRTLGPHDTVEADLRRVTIAPGQRYLVCSDGLWGTVRDEATLREILAGADSPDEAVRTFITTANDQGGDDNIGVAVCEVM